MKLTKMNIDRLKPNGRDTVLWDDDLPGFGLRLNPGGKPSFIVQYRNAQGRSRRITIGSYGRLAADEARQMARKLLSRAELDQDPAEDKQEVKNAITVAALCEEYFEKARKGLVLGRGGRKKKAAALDIDEGRACRHIVPLLGGKPARNVTSNDIRAFIEAVTFGKTADVIKTEKPRGKAVVKGGEGTARRTVAMLSGIFTYAVKVGYCSANPCRGVELTPDGEREVRLSPEEYAGLGQAIDTAEAASAHWRFVAIARLIALTGLRHNEAVKLKTREVDFDYRCLRLADTKTGPSLRPLGEPALNLLRGVVRPDALYVFPGFAGPNKPYGAFPKQWKRHVGGSLTPHCLRHALGSTAHELGVSEIVIAHLLGHTASGTTTRKYIHAPDKLVLDAADRTSRYIASVMGLEADNVIGLPTRRKGAGVKAVFS